MITAKNTLSFVLVILTVLLRSGVRSLPISPDGKALVIATGINASDQATSVLTAHNQNYQLLLVGQSGTPLPTLESNNIGNFGLIIIIGMASYNYGGTIGWASALTADQLTALYVYQVKYGIRLIHLDGYPDNFMGTALAAGPGGCCVTEEQTVYLTNDTFSLSPGPLPTHSTIGLWHYPAVIADVSTTKPFLAFGSNSQYPSETVAGVVQDFGGRTQLVFFLAGASWSSTSNYLGDVWFHWGYLPPLNSTTSAPRPALVIATSADAATHVTSLLMQYGRPYQLLTVPKNGVPLPPLQTVDASNNAVGNFGLIVVVGMASYSYGGPWASAITAAQWLTLYSYQTTFRVRMVHLDGYPLNFPGLALARGSVGCCSSGEQFVYAVDTALVAAAGLQVTNLTTVGLWHYPAVITNPTTTTPFLRFAPNSQFPNTTLAGVTQNLDGRQQMIFLLAGASWSSTTKYLGRLWLIWGYQVQTGPTSTSTSSSQVAIGTSTSSSSSVTSTSSSTTSTGPRPTGIAVTEFSPYQSLVGFSTIFKQWWTGYGCTIVPNPSRPSRGNDNLPGVNLTTALSNCSLMCNRITTSRLLVNVLVITACVTFLIFDNSTMFYCQLLISLSLSKSD